MMPSELLPICALLAGLLMIAACCAVAGKAIPFVSLIGLDVIVALLVPSYLAHAKIFDPAALAVVGRGFGTFHVLDWFIAVIILGSLLSIDLRHLARISARMLIPLLLGSILATAGATLIGVICGFTADHALFYLAVPVLAGGLTAGAIPLASGYASITGIDQGSALALLLPPVVIGNIFAVACAGLNRAARNEHHMVDATGPSMADSVTTPYWFVVALALLALLRWVSQEIATLLHTPSVLILIALVTVLHLGGVFVGPLRVALLAINRFVLRWLIFPILTLVGLLLLPWDIILIGLTAANLLTIATVAVILMATGRIIAPRLQMDRAEVATIMLTRAAMGGTGNIAILRAAQRLTLMPIAQLATRLGGALTVALALAAITLMKR